MTENNRMDPNDPDLMEGQRIAGLMEIEMRKHKPSIEADLRGGRDRSLQLRNDGPE
jgi:hypothetical protein